MAVKSLRVQGVELVGDTERSPCRLPPEDKPFDPCNVVGLQQCYVRNAVEVQRTSDANHCSLIMEWLYVNWSPESP